MIVILSIIGLTSVLALTGLNVLILRQNDRIDNQVGAICNFLAGVFSKPDPNSDPLIHQIINLNADLTGQRVAQSLFNQQKAAVGGSIKGINSALEAEAIEAYPDMAIAQALQKALPKNQIAQAGLGMLIKKILAGSGGSTNILAGSGGSRTNGQSRFDL